METKLLFGASIPEFDLNTIDDPSNHNSGHYFLLNDDDGRRKASERMLVRLNKSAVWDKFVQRNGNSLTFQQTAVDEYLKDDEYFRELLALLIMFTCGMSGRGTEMTSLRYMNTMDGDRNITIEGGQFMLVTEYHKSQAMMDESKVHWNRDCVNIR